MEIEAQRALADLQASSETANCAVRGGCFGLETPGGRETLRLTRCV